MCMGLKPDLVSKAISPGHCIFIFFLCICEIKVRKCSSKIERSLTTCKIDSETNLG